MRVFDARCAACGGDLQHPTWSPWPGFRRRLRRVVRAVLLTTVVVGAPTLFLLQRYSRRAEVQPWRIRARIDALAVEDPPDWQQVRVLARQLVDLQPTSAQGWYMLALSGRRLGYSARLAVRETLEALRHDPQLGEAHLLAAVELAALGEHDEARRHAAEALRWSMAPPEAWRLAGELELTRVRPDVERALAHFEEARRRGLWSVELEVRAALLRQRLVGVVAPERYPPDLTVALRRARLALEREDDDGAPGLREWFAAEVEFAEGHEQEARRFLELGLQRTEGQSADALVRARLLTTKARVEMAKRRDPEAVDAFRAALAASTSPEIVGGVTRILTASGRTGMFREVLGGVAAEDDPFGSVRAALAEGERSAGRLDEALRLVREAIAASPGSSDLHVLLGDVLRDRGALDEARAAYETAAAAAGDALPALLRAALLPLYEKGGDAVARAQAVAARVGELRASHGDDPGIDIALGRALLAAGRADEATVAFENVVRALPWSASAWLDLAEAWRLSGAPDATERSSDCASEAARMRPFDRDVVLAVARATARNGDDAAAVLATTIYLERTPDDVGVLRQRAQARLRLGDWATAVEDLEAVRAAGGDELVVRLQLADAFVRAGRDEDAWALVAAAADAAERRALEVVLATHRMRPPPPGLEPASAIAVAVRHARDGDPEAALAVLRDAHAAGPRDAMVARALIVLLCGPDLAAIPIESRLREARAALVALGESGGAGLTALLRGRLLLVEGDAPGAVALLRNATEALPWDAGAHFLLAEALFATDAEDAREAYTRALWMPGGHAAYGPAIAVRLLTLAERADDAAARERTLREALRADAALSAAALLLFDDIFRRGAFREAAEVAERGIAALPRDRDVAVEIALRKRALAARMEIGEAELAGRHLDALERIGGSVERPATVRGLVALRRRRPAEAVELFRTALTNDDGDRLAALGLAEALVQSEDVDAALVFVRARIDAHPDELPLARVVTRTLVRTGRADAALRVADDLLSRAPDDVESVRQRVWLLGLLDRSEEALATARDAARSAHASSDPARRADAGLLDVLGAECLLQLAGRAADALEEARRVAAEPAVSGEARLSARVVEAECLVELGRSADADAVVRSLTAGWRDDRPPTASDAWIEPRVRFVMGMVAFQRGRPEVAVAAFVRAVQLDPVHHAAANNAAWCIAQTDASSPAALELARRATAARPGEATYWDTRALCERGAGLWEEALASWRRADELLTASSAPPGERAHVLLSRAELLLDLNRGDEAREAARSIIVLAPDAPEAARARIIAGRR